MPGTRRSTQTDPVSKGKVRTATQYHQVQSLMRASENVGMVTEWHHISQETGFLITNSRRPENEQEWGNYRHIRTEQPCHPDHQLQPAKKITLDQKGRRPQIYSTKNFRECRYGNRVTSYLSGQFFLITSTDQTSLRDRRILGRQQLMRPRSRAGTGTSNRPQSASERRPTNETHRERNTLTKH